MRPGYKGAAWRLRRLRGLLVAAGLAASVSVSLSGCVSLGVQGDDGSQTSFVAGDGTWELIAEPERGAPVELSGQGTDGSTIDLASLRGQVVVVNVWYAACAPCRIEAPDLAAAAQDYAGSGVAFVGINTRDTQAAANAFEQRFAIPYPSVLDAETGQALLALRGVVPPAAVPTTIVIDTQGRPAGRIVGLADPAVLRGMIDQVTGIAPASPPVGTGEESSAVEAEAAAAPSTDQSESWVQAPRQQATRAEPGAS